MHDDVSSHGAGREGYIGGSVVMMVMMPYLMMVVMMMMMMTELFSVWCWNSRLNADTVRLFRNQFLTARNMVLAAAGIAHDDFVKLAEKHFGNLPSG